MESFKRGVSEKKFRVWIEEFLNGVSSYISIGMRYILEKQFSRHLLNFLNFNSTYRMH